MRVGKDQYKEILENLYDGVYLVDRERRIGFWNKGAERITGFTAGQVVGRHCMDNILNHVTENGTQLCLNGCPLHSTIEDGTPRIAEVFLHHVDGHRVPVMIRTTPLHNEKGEIVGAVEVFSDNTALFSTRRHIDRLEQSVLLDPLTNLGNRRFIEIRLKSALAEFQEHGVPFGVLFIDIDHFKEVNDRYGHNVGDRVLSMVASSLHQNLRMDDALARWGGEEFVAVLTRVEQSGLRNSAEKLVALVRNSFLHIDDQNVSVTVSIGATLPIPGEDAASLLRRADMNMYRRKQVGGDGVAYDEPDPAE